MFYPTYLVIMSSTLKISFMFLNCNITPRCLLWGTEKLIKQNPLGLYDWQTGILCTERIYFKAPADPIHTHTHIHAQRQTQTIYCIKWGKHEVGKSGVLDFFNNLYFNFQYRLSSRVNHLSVVKEFLLLDFSGPWDL